PKIEKEGNHLTAAMSACVSISSALDAVNDPSPESAVSAAFSALDAVTVFVASYSDQPDTSEPEWQERALQLVESWGEKPVDPGMFRLLDDDPPAWMGRLPH